FPAALKINLAANPASPPVLLLNGLVIGRNWIIVILAAETTSKVREIKPGAITKLKEELRKWSEHPAAVSPNSDRKNPLWILIAGAGGAVAMIVLGVILFLAFGTKADTNPPADKNPPTRNEPETPRPEVPKDKEKPADPNDKGKPEDP